MGSFPRKGFAGAAGVDSLVCTGKRDSQRRELDSCILSINGSHQSFQVFELRRVKNGIWLLLRLRREGLVFSLQSCRYALGETRTSFPLLPALILEASKPHVLSLTREGTLSDFNWNLTDCCDENNRILSSLTFILRVAIVDLDTCWNFFCLNLIPNWWLVFEK